MHRARDACANGNRDVDVRGTINVALLEQRLVHIAALLFGKLDAPARTLVLGRLLRAAIFGLLLCAIFAAFLRLGLPGTRLILFLARSLGSSLILGRRLSRALVLGRRGLGATLVLIL